jgi:hypothetical protein
MPIFLTPFPYHFTKTTKALLGCFLLDNPITPAGNPPVEGKSKKIKRTRLAAFTVFMGWPSKAYQLCLIRMKLQTKAVKPFLHYI